MRFTMLCLVLAVASCEDEPKRVDGPVAPRSTVDTDALWAMAPTGARGGVVVSARAVGLAEDSFAMVRAYVASSPDLAPLAEELDAALARTGGSSRLADWGLTRTKGFALFLLPDGMVALLPVGDRDVFLAKAKGQKGNDSDTIDSTTCKTVRGYYACATSPAILDELGKGDLKSKLAAIGARGEIELVGNALPFTEARTGTLAAVVQIARGSAAMRGTISGLPADVTKKLGAASKPRASQQRSSGFGVIDVRPWLADAPDAPVTGDLTFSQLVATIAGPLTIDVPAGQPTLEMQLPLTEPTKMKQFIEHCTDFSPLAELGATLENGGCHLKIAESAIDLEAWVEGNTLRVGKRSGDVTGKLVPMSPIGVELSRGEWSIAFWGRGTLFGPAAIPPSAPPGELPAQAKAAIRITSLLDEGGFGVKLVGDSVAFVATLRTAFGNPDDVLTKLLAITAEDLVGGKASQRAQPIVDAHPTSPFARDYAAGQGGMIIPTALIGMAANVGVPLLRAALAKPE